MAGTVSGSPLQTPETPRAILSNTNKCPADRGEYRQPAGVIAEAIAFSEDGASGAEPSHVVPAGAGTWDWLHRTRHLLSRCPSIVEALRTRNSCHRLYNCPRRTMDSFARRPVFHYRRLPRKPRRSLGRVSWSPPNIAVVLRYKRLSPCFISSPCDAARICVGSGYLQRWIQVAKEKDRFLPLLSLANENRTVWRRRQGWYRNTAAITATAIARLKLHRPSGRR